MAQRISRAKQRIKSSGVAVPAAARRTSRRTRLRSVLHVLYLIFNEGYASSAGAKLHRTELSDEAIRLTRMVHRLLPDDPRGRRAARAHAPDRRAPTRTNDPRGRADPARGAGPHAVGPGAASPRGSRCSTAALARGAGRASTSSRLRSRPCTTARRRAEDTDWQQILALYGLLEQMTRQSDRDAQPRRRGRRWPRGRDAGLELLDAVDESLAGHYRLDAVRAHLLEMAGDTDAAREHYRAAANRTTNLAEQRYLVMRAARLESDGD